MLKIDSISLNYEDRSILKGAYLECCTGEVVGLLGRNGCGKSTLLKIIFGTANSSYKHISIDGIVVNKGYQHNKVAYLPQNSYLPHTIPIRKLARQLVKPEEWTKFESIINYQECFNKTPGELAGGELRQMELLMILYSRADYLLLDEPFTHLSPVMAEEFKLFIQERSQIKGIIVTDHQYKSIIDVSDRLYLIDNGYTRTINTMDDLVTYGYLSGNNNLYK